MVLGGDLQTVVGRSQSWFAGAAGVGGRRVFVNRMGRNAWLAENRGIKDSHSNCKIN